uniref:ZM domain-containing protein n=1 Tax=Macrostomum lignano TaxID=282301 RepID=A0A1I8JGE1_9PLAT
SRHHPHDIQSAPNPRSELSQQQQQPGYEPFGRPGAGAPLRDRDGRIVPSVFGATAKFEETPGEKQKKAEAAKIYSQELDQLSRSSVGKPPRDPRTGVLLDQHLPSSDVTHINYKTPRHKFQSMTGYQPLPAFVQTASGYGSELEQAAMERAAARRIDRAREMHEADRHAQAFDRMFGRPGAGAPVSAGAKKVNLDKALHNPDGMRNEYKKTVEHVTQVPSTSYVRNNNGSNHGNAYQIQSNGSDAYRQPYNLLAPYAIQKQA